MSVERQVLAALIKNREAFNLLQPVIQDDDFSVQGQLVYKYINEYYTKDEEAASIDENILLSRIQRKHQKHATLFEELFDELDECSVVNVVDEFVELKRTKVGEELITAITTNDNKLIAEKLQEYQELQDTDFLNHEDDSIIYQPKLKDLLAKRQEAGHDTLAVVPKQLNKLLKKRLRRGHHIIIFAVVEIGKTLFVINFASGFCKRGYKVLYLCNEEPEEDVTDRFLSRFTKIPIDKVWKGDVDKTEELAYKNGYGNLMLVKAHAGTLLEIERLVKEHKPDVLIVDQIKNLEIPGATDEMSTVIKASRFMRRMGKQYNLVAVSVTQAGDSASGRTVLQLRDIYQSKTAVAGDADLMIGIGANENMIQHNRRMINLPKNKVSGQHKHFSVEVDPRISKVISV